METTLGKRTEGRVSLMRTTLVNSKNRKKKTSLHLATFRAGKTPVTHLTGVG